MNDYDQVHAQRFALSLAAIRPLLKPGLRILELGGRGTFTQMVETEIGGAVETWDHDLRAPFNLNGAFGLVLCMEVIEHLHDQERVKPTEWNGSGVDAMLRSAFSALAPRGQLFLSTPNACSHNILAKALNGLAPMVYRPHVREYTPQELRGLLHAAGFGEIQLTSHDCWGGGLDPHDPRAQHVRALAAKYSGHERGECLFALAKKS